MGRDSTAGSPGGEAREVVTIAEPTTVVDLPGQRVIAADDVGDPGGVAVVYLHGSPDCRLARHPDDGIAASLGVRLIAVDRPGYGWSTPQPTPDVLGWGGDVAMLLDELGIARCRVAAWSAGAPYALGLAAAMPERVERVVTYGCLAPLEAFDDEDVAGDSPTRAPIAADVAAGTPIEEIAEAFAALLIPPPPVDLELARAVVLENYSRRARAEVELVPGMLEQMARSLAAAVGRYGAAGGHADMAIQFRPGSADVLALVDAPVTLVHGEHDPVAGPAVGRWLARRLARARVEVWDRGHQGLLPEWERWLSLAASSQA